MQLTERERQAYELGALEAQAQAAATIASSLRGLVAAVRSEQAAQAGLLARARAALLWQVTEAWCARVERFAGELVARADQITAEVAKRREAMKRSQRPRSWWRKE